MPYDARKNINQNARPTDSVPEVRQDERAIMRPDFHAAAPASPYGGTGNFGLPASAIANEQVAREVATVQAQMVIAKQFPRNREAAMDHIQSECSRITLAEKAAYRYQRGGTDIFGASIDLLRSISQCWGNLESGWKEVERVDGTSYAPGHSKIIAYAIDFETNVRKSREFTVYHVRENGKIVTDDRDIYEVTANKASRRERACLEAIIPKDVVDWALDLCIQTSVNYNKQHMDINKMLNSFRSAFGVSKAQIEQFIGRKAEAMDVTLYVRLRSIYKSLQDGVGEVSDFFKPVEEPVTEQQASTTTPKTARTPKKKQEPQNDGEPAKTLSGQDAAPVIAPEPDSRQDAVQQSTPAMYSDEADMPDAGTGEMSEDEYMAMLREEQEAQGSPDDDLDDEGDY